MGLIDKIKDSAKKLALAGILGSSFYINGCGPALMGIGAGAGGVRGAALSAFGQGITQIEAAQAGKDEIKQDVRVIVVPQTYNSYTNNANNFLRDDLTINDPLLGEIIIGSCNYVHDIERNGINYPEDFQGIKKSFSGSEKITFYVLAGKGVSIISKLLDKNGKIVRTHSKYPVGNDVNNFLDEYKPGELQEGHYTALFYSDDKFVGKREIEVR